MSNERYCPDCGTALPFGATRCSCGWQRENKAQGGLKCLCGELARITIRERGNENYYCWPCYHNRIKKTMYEDWRDTLVREYCREHQCHKMSREEQIEFMRNGMKKIGRRHEHKAES